MSRTERSRPTRVAVLIMSVVGTLALGACGAGQLAQTSQQVAAVGGAEAGNGDIVVRDAQIEFGSEVEGANVYRRGGDAPLRMSIVNTGADGDRLVSVTSAWADRVVITGDTEVPGGSALVVEGEPTAPVAVPAPEATGTPAPGATNPATPTSSAPATPTPAPPTTVTDGERKAQIVLTGLRDDIRTGLTYEIVMTFERAGEIRFSVPVANPSTPREDGSPA